MGYCSGLPLSAQEVDQLIELLVHPFLVFHPIGMGSDSTPLGLEADKLEALDPFIECQTL